MRYVVIGAGAIGGTIGVRLHEAGRDVVLVARGAHLDAIREHGLRLDEPGRTRTARLPAAGSVAEVGWRDGDVAVLCTKTQDTAPLLDELAAAAPDVPIVCAQNGVANERMAAARFTRVQAICVVLPAEHLEPGLVVTFSGADGAGLDVGRYPSGVDDLTTAIADDLTAAGFSCRATPEIMPWKYSKLLMNLGNAVEACCGLDDPDAAELGRAARAEGRRCLAAAGIAIPTREEQQARLAELRRGEEVDGRPRHGGSTWQSMQRGTGSVEVEALTGEIVRIGREHGVPTPINDVLLETTLAMAAAGERPGARSAADLLDQGSSRSATTA